MAWDASVPTNSGLLVNFPAQCRANWDAIALGTDSSLLITNAKVSASAAIVDTKLNTISTAGKVSGAALTSLASVPSGAGNLPINNLGNACLLTTDQTVAGVKTFSSFPVTPSSAPTTDYQTANKKYVDDASSAAGQAKAWVKFAGGTGAIQDHFNVSGVSRTATGKYTITWDTNFANDDYAVVVTCQDTVAGSVAMVYSAAVGSCVVWTYNSGVSLQDKDFVHVIAFGDQ